jgi:TonB-linked SusC/RagA family outer membrane protein
MMQSKMFLKRYSVIPIKESLFTVKKGFMKKPMLASGLESKQLERKILFKTKILIISLLATTLQLSATGFTQTITMSKKSVPLEQVIKEIEKQSGFHFFYNERLLESAYKVSIEVKNATLESTLEKCFANQPLTYSIFDKTIVIKRKSDEIAKSASLIKELLFIDVSGKVVNEKAIPLTGVSIIIKGTSKGTSTNIDGEFALSNVGAGTVLVFSMTGYKTVEHKVPANGKISIQMVEEISIMQDVVITGYQSIKKKQFTGAATKLNADDAKIAGITDVSRMLEGRVAGVSIQNVSGTFGAAPKVRVRGATSISGENKPLWVIDGIVLEDMVNISNDQLSSGDPSTLLGSAVAGLNPEDIASFEILKDASATALYGGRAMNGVIVITTKKGRAGKPTINYSSNYTVKLKPSYSNYNIMNSADQMSVYSEMMRKGWLNYSDALRAPDGGVFTKMYKLISTYNETDGTFGLENTPEARSSFLERYARNNTNWFDILFKNSLLQEHSISISSGTPEAQYYFSTSFLNDAGWSISDKVKRVTGNMRANYKLSDKLTAGLSAIGSVRMQTAPGSNSRVANVVEGVYTRDFDINPFSYALNTSRVLTAYDEKGGLEYFNRNYAPFNILNELSNNTINLNMMDARLQGELGYKFTRNLEFNSIGAIRFVKTSREHKIREQSNMALAYKANYDNVTNNRNRFLYNDPDSPDADKVVVLPQGGFYNRTEDQLVNYNIRNTLNWKNNINELNSLQILLGQEIKSTDRQNTWNNGFGYQYDKGGIPFTDYRIIKQMLEGNFNYFGMQEYYDRNISFFSNAIYSFDDKYIFNGTFRYDGSNRMGQSRKARWLPTWTLSGAWNVDEEKFMQRFKKLDYLKVRGSYGLTASIGSATNSSVVLENTSTRRPVFSDIESQIIISNLENSELTWEKQYELNAGIDLSWMKGKFSMTFDVYKRDGFDLISSIRTSGIGGQSVKVANYADMKSKGIEVTLGTKLINSNNWTYQTNFTFGYNTNKIVNLKNTPRIIDLIRSEGGPKEGATVRGLYSIQFLGLNPSNGIPYFLNESGKTGQSVYVQDLNTSYLKYEGSIDPLITGGFNNTLRWKNLSLNVFFSYQTGNKIRLDAAYKTRYTDLDAMPREFFDRWTLPGDEKITNVPSILYMLDAGGLSGVYPYSNYNYTTVRVADGSFVRLKTASLQYSMTSKWIKTIGAKNLSFGMVATNLWLIYADPLLKGQDPEFFQSGGVAMPMPRQFTLTAKLGF